MDVALSQNDWGLLSLLYGTQLEALQPYNIELICSHSGGENIRNKYGFLRNVKILGELDNCQDYIEVRPPNTFLAWLLAKVSSLKASGFNLEEKNLKYVNQITGA